MIIIFADKQEVAFRAHYDYLRMSKVDVLLVENENVLSFSMKNNFPVLDLKDKRQISSHNNIFINRVYDLPPHHPLNFFMFALEEDKLLMHPVTSGLFTSKTLQFQFFHRTPHTRIIKGDILQQKENICVKVLSQERVCVNELLSNRFYPEGAKTMPVVYQEIVHGKSLKIILIGNDVFCYHYISSSLDPKAGTKHVTALMPDEKLRHVILEISKRIQVNYFDCDIIQREDGAYVVLEINPSPVPYELACFSGDEAILERFTRFLINREYEVLPLQ